MKRHDETLILSLIKDNLINMKLVHGLNDLGLLAGDYFLHLSETVLHLMGFSKEQRDDELYDAYMERMQRVKFVDLSHGHGAVDELAREVYTWLCGERGK